MNRYRVQISSLATTNECQEKPPNNDRESPKKTAMRRSVVSKKLIPHFDLIVSSRVVWLLSQHTVFVLEL